MVTSPAGARPFPGEEGRFRRLHFWPRRRLHDSAHFLRSLGNREISRPDQRSRLRRHVGHGHGSPDATHDVLGRLNSTEEGLASSCITERLARLGPNIVGSHHVRALTVLAGQVRNPLILLLLLCAGVSGLTGDPTDAIIIAVIIGLSVGLGFFNEFRAEVAVAALHDRIRRRALVWRDGQATEVDVTELVPGDVVALRVGDLVPADVRLLEVHGLECDEAILTGESMPASKCVEADAGATGMNLPCCAFMGTIVHQGSGRAAVVATGPGTEFGRIAAGLSERPTETAFQAGLRGFSRFLVIVAGVLTVSIFAINVGFHRPLIEALLFSLAIAVGITPEMMPAIVTVSLSAGARRTGEASCIGQAFGGDRGPRKHRITLHRQDGHADRGSYQLQPIARSRRL